MLPTGEIIETGGKVVKNVVGYDLTHLLVGSEGTLAIITKVMLRLVPRPQVQTTIRACFTDVSGAVRAVTNIIKERVVPAALELVDGDSLDAVAAALGTRSLAPEGTGAILLLEVDGWSCRCRRGCGARRARLPRRRRDRSPSRSRRRGTRRSYGGCGGSSRCRCSMIAPVKFNHDVVVPRGRIPELFALVGSVEGAVRPQDPVVRPRRRRQHPRQHHVGPERPGEVERAHEAERALFEGVVALEGAISGEHGIGFAKARFLEI